MAISILRRFPLLNYVPIKANRAHSIVKTTIHRSVGQQMLQRNASNIEREAKPQLNATVTRSDLLSLLTRAYADGHISLTETKDHISMFIMAGHETTSQTLSFTLWELARNPVVQDRLREELAPLRNHELSPDEVTKYPYLDAVCKESLRLHPALPYMERVATKDDTIPLAEPINTPRGLLHHIPIHAGQIIVTPIISIQKRAAVWGADATEWKPERWLAENKHLFPDSKSLPDGVDNLLAFSQGPRLCIGWRLGIFQYKAILSSLILDFEFVDTAMVIETRTASSLQPYVHGELEAGPILPLGVRMIS